MEPSLDPVIAEANANRHQFEAFCRSLTLDELQSPIPAAAWQARDYIAHLATIDIWVNDWFEHLADGSAWRPTGGGGEAFSIDVWNESHVQERKAASIEDLLTEADGHRQRLWATLERFTPEVLDRRFDFHDNNITFLRYLQLWAGHDPAHTADMLRGLPGRADDPELRIWLGRYHL